jgi:hypothetical protein
MFVGKLPRPAACQRLTLYGVAFKSYKEEYLDGSGIFRDAVIRVGCPSSCAA